ncbi:MAG: hypothetical protein JNK74_28095, partial [Candidatus Hydrogenedentes bacterium]|nr:hypothetical protein [Candidatus Hydrogenedentota bacterium]
MMRLGHISLSGLKKKLKNRLLIAPLAAVVAATALTGCPLPEDNPQDGAKLTMLLAADDGAFTTAKNLGNKARVVQQSEIDSLFVNVDEIRLRRTIEGGSEQVTVFADPIQINLLDLVGVNDVLDSAVVPVGSYTEVEMLLSTPRLTLASDPATVIENISLLDGGNLTVASSFTATENGTGLLVLQLGSISLVSLDDGSFQLVPDLQVDLFDSSVEAQAIGIISSIDASASTFVLKRDAAALTVSFDGASIFKPSDFDSPTGSATDLVVGLKVFASGNLSVDGNLLGDIVVIFPDAPSNNNSNDEFTIQINGAGTDLNAHGEAEYEIEGARRKFKVEAEDLTYSGIVDIWVDGVLVGSVDTASDEKGDISFRLDTRLGDTPPVLTRESLVELLAGGTDQVILSSAAPSNGGDDNGGDDNGGDDNGGDDNGGDDNGGDDNGGDDNGGDDNGGDDNGGDDNGGDDNGGDDNGGDDNGGDDNDDDSGDDNGGDDNGDDNGDDSSDDDSGDDNSDDNGTDDSGDDSSDDNGTDDSGDDSSDDNGGDTSGSDDTG